MTWIHARYDKVKRFGSHEKAIAAVEFALILPIMLVVFVGVTQVGEAVSIGQKVTITARTITDLVTRENSPLAASELNTDLQAAAQVMVPYPSSTLTVTVSEISTDAKGNATVAWSGSWPNNANALLQGSPFTLPSSLAGANVTVVYGQVSYGYTPLLGYKVIGPMTISDGIYFYPRTGACISGPGYTCP
jgi:Flp pilus assembly protein TadG